MSRRSMALAAALAIAAGVAVFLIAGRDGSSSRAASAGPGSVSARRSTEADSVASPTREGPRLEAEQAPAEEPKQVVAPQPHIAPELAARVEALAGNKGSAPKGDAGVSRSRLTFGPGELAAERDAAMAVLAEHPKDVNALRTVVSTSCATKDGAAARKYIADLPPGDRADMRESCRRHGVDLDDGRWKTGETSARPPKQRPPK